MEDGSVIIKVEMQTDQVDAGVDDIKAGCRRAAGAAADMGKKIGASVSDAARAGESAQRRARVTLDGLRASLNSVKLSLSAAFTPVVTAVAPMLQKLCAMLVTAADHVAGFFAVLGGRKSYLGVSGAGEAAAAKAAAPAGMRVASVGPEGPAADETPGVQPIAAAARSVSRAAVQSGGGMEGKSPAGGYAAMSAAIDAASASAARFGKTAADSFSAAGRAIDETADRAGGTAKAISSAGEAASDTAGGVKRIAKAAKQAERNLSGLDELNIWKSDEAAASGGGGGSGKGGKGGAGGQGAELGGAFGEGFAGALEEIPIDGAAEHWMHHILTLVGAVAAGLAAWKLARSFGADMRTAASLALGVAGAVALVRGGMEAWSRGVDWGNLLEMLGGTAALAGGLALAFGKVGGAVGLLAGGMTLLVTGFRDWWVTGELTNQSLAAVAAGLLAVGGAIGLLTGSWIPLIIAGVTAALLAVAKFTGRSGELIDGIRQTCKGFVDFIAGVFTGDWSRAWDGIKNIFAGAWNVIKTLAVSVWEGIKAAAGTGYNWVKDKFTAMGASIREKVSAAKQAAVEKFTQIRDGIAEKLTAAKEKVTGVFDGIRDSIREKIDAAKEFVRSAIDRIKGFFDFQWELPKIKLPHFKLTGEFSLMPPKVPHLSVDWYARGGIVDGATLIGAGEAGKEAIIPLERHTQWIDAVAARLAKRLGAARPAGLEAAADRLGELAASIQRLGLAIERAPAPVMAGGTVIPPRAVYADGTVQGLTDLGAQLRQLLASSGAPRSGDGRSASYTFIGRIDRRVLFREVLDEAALQRTRTGKNPFDL